MKSRTKVAIAVGALLAAAVLWEALGPLITVRDLKAAVEQQDVEKLSDNVDFPTLRSNLKEQFDALIATKVATDTDKNPFQALGMMFASKIADTMIDSMVTPSGMANLLAGKAPGRPQAEVQQPAQADTTPKPVLFRNARYIYDSLSKFSVWVPSGDGSKELRLVLTREGFSWRLSNLVIPPIT